MEYLESLNARYPCREPQIRQLALALSQADLPSPPALVLYGTEATGKSTIVRAALDRFGIPYAYVSCRECVTSRHLFEKVFASCEALAQAHQTEGRGEGMERTKTSRPDSVNALASQLQKILSHVGKIVLVLDGVDKHRDITAIMLSGLSYIGQMVGNLTTLIVANTHCTSLLSIDEPPSIYFPAYNKDECIRILSLTPKSIFNLEPGDEYSAEMEEEDRWLWEQSCSAVWDIMGKHTASNINALRDVMDNLWPLLIKPIVGNEYGIRDFPRLINRLKNDRLKNDEDSYVFLRISNNISPDRFNIPNSSHDLPYFSKYLLCAAFLASYNTAKYDSRYFSKLSEQIGKRKHAIAKKPTTRQLNRKHLGPRPFPLERMIAIFYSILPISLPSSTELGSQVATLGSLRLIRRISGVSSVTDASSKWRVNIGHEYAKTIARSIGLDIDSHLEQ